MIGKTLQEIGIRKNYGVEPIMLLSGDREERGDFFSDAVLQAGSTLIVHGLWERMHAAADNIRFVLATPIEQAPTRKPSSPLPPSSALPPPSRSPWRAFPSPSAFLREPPPWFS